LIKATDLSIEGKPFLNKKMNPKVSIIMATFNRAHLIEETLISIQNQTMSDWECLIIDDGGTDNTKEVIKPILEKDQRFKFLKRPNNYKKQIPGCRNYGLDIAAGDFIIFFDDDDIVHPQNLELCIKELQNNKYNYCRYERKVFSGSFNQLFDLSKSYKTSEITQNDLDSFILNILQFNSCQVMWEKRCFDSLRFNETLLYAEEWECYGRILMKPIIGINIQKTLFYGRKHKNSNTGEFWNDDPIRLQSQKRAVFLMCQNLNKSNLLSTFLLHYLCGLSISYRDRKLLIKILDTANSDYWNKLKLKFKFIFFPVYKKWIYIRRTLKKRRK